MVTRGEVDNSEGMAGRRGQLKMADTAWRRARQRLRTRKKRRLIEQVDCHDHGVLRLAACYYYLSEL